jgi:hypothetical protein
MSGMIEASTTRRADVVLRPLDGVKLLGERRRDLDVGERSLPPASTSSTRIAGSADRRLASTQPTEPAEPAPTMM